MNLNNGQCIFLLLGPNHRVQFPQTTENCSYFLFFLPYDNPLIPGHRLWTKETGAMPQSGLASHPSDGTTVWSTFKLISTREKKRTGVCLASSTRH